MTFLGHFAELKQVLLAQVAAIKKSLDMPENKCCETCKYKPACEVQKFTGVTIGNEFNILEHSSTFYCSEFERSTQC